MNLKACAHCGQLMERRIECDGALERPVMYACRTCCSKRCAGALAASKRRVSPEPTAVAGCRWIPLTQGKFTLVDEADYEMLARYSWAFSSQGYAVTDIPRHGRKPLTVALHGLLLCPDAPEDEVDHRNRNKLDNRRSNLRIANPRQQGANVTKSVGRSSPFRGVYRNHRPGRAWIVRCAGKEVGTYNDLIQAAAEYNRAALVRWGEFAVLNRMD